MLGVLVVAERRPEDQEGERRHAEIGAVETIHPVWKAFTYGVVRPTDACIYSFGKATLMYRSSCEWRS